MNRRALPPVLSRFQKVKRRLARWIGRRGAPPPGRLPDLAPDGFTENRTSAPYIEILDDAALAELNRLLQWRNYTIDSKGRRFGHRTEADQAPGLVPDPRIVTMHEHFDLSDKHVLEVGCFEGVHTLGLCQFAAEVTAIDARVDNVVKTVVRCAFHGHRPLVFVCDLESWEDDGALACDLVHHVGVLYHLRDPIRHLQRLPAIARVGVLLDTHVAEDHEATESMTVDGRAYRYKRRPEPSSRQASRAGMYDHAKWLCLDDILQLLDEGGLAPVTLVDRRVERNGTRVTILAGPSSTSPGSRS